MPVLLLAVAALLAAAGAARAQDTPASGDLAPGLRWAQVFMDRMVRVAVPAAPAHAASGDAAHAAPGDAAHAAPGNAERDGYGFIVGEQMLRVQGRAQPFAALLIATADNLVRGATAAAPPVVTFYGDLSRSLPASVLATHLAPEQGNLAVLLVLRPPNARIRPIPAIDTAALLPGIFAWQIGRPDQWLPAETPGRFAAPDKGWLTFDGLDGEAGALGAAVLTDRGLAGMVAGAAPDGRTRVLSVERMRAALRGWRLDWTIADPGAVTLAGPAAAAASALPAAPPGGGDRRGLSVLPLMASEIASRGAWVPPGARLSPWARRGADLRAAPTADAARIGAMPPGSELPPDRWRRGAYQILHKLDHGAWFLAGTEGQPLGYVSGNDIIEVWPLATPAQQGGRALASSQSPIAGAVLHDAGTHFVLSLALRCPLDFCDTVEISTPEPPRPGGILPVFQVPPLTGAWHRGEAVPVSVLLPRALVRKAGARLEGCVGLRRQCIGQTLLTGAAK